MFYLAFEIVLSGKDGLKVLIPIITKGRSHVLFKDSGLWPVLIIESSYKKIVLFNILKGQIVYR